MLAQGYQYANNSPVCGAYGWECWSWVAVIVGVILLLASLCFVCDLRRRWKLKRSSLVSDRWYGSIITSRKSNGDDNNISGKRINPIRRTLYGTSGTEAYWI